MARVAVIGAGTWGTIMASILAERADTVLWARRPVLADEIAARNVNSAYLPELALPASLRATSSLEEASRRVDLVVMAVPSHGFRAVLSDAAEHLPPRVPVLSLTKGLEQGSLKRMTEIVAEVAPGHAAGVLTGPNLAREVMHGQPTASVIAFTDDRLATTLQALFCTDTFRVYTNPDVVGCELAGALKNVVAIASGMAEGLGFGDNTRAALITRGLAELTRLGCALGGHPLTFSGLAGMGDLVATCMSRLSRNRHVGEQVGRGRPVDEVTAEMPTVAEGVRTSAAVCGLAARYGVEVPIAEQVVAVVYGGKRAADVMPALMQREAKPEVYGIGDGRTRRRPRRLAAP